jgi:hypothetical protein
MNRAAAALGGVTPDIGACEADILPDEIDQKCARLDVTLVTLTVDLD